MKKLTLTQQAEAQMKALQNKARLKVIKQYLEYIRKHRSDISSIEEEIKKKEEYIEKVESGEIHCSIDINEDVDDDDE